MLWQLGSQKKDFLPRMGAEIKFISVSADDKFVVVTLSNNGKFLLGSDYFTSC